MPKLKPKIWKALFFALAFVVLMNVFMGDDQGGEYTSEIGEIRIMEPIFSSHQIMDRFFDAEQDENMKVLILRIDSPGGLAASSQELYRRVIQFKKRTGKPVLVSVENLCASGAYYIASAADTIIANPSSEIGSIGVIANLVNMRELFDKFGLKSRNFKTGSLKDAGDPLKELTDEQVELEKKYFEEIIFQIYDQFVADVSTSRGLDEAKVRKLAHGGVFTGTQALSDGLIDGIGNYVDVVELASRIAGVKPIHAIPTIYTPADDRGFLERAIFGTQKDSALKKILGRRHILSLTP